VNLQKIGTHVGQMYSQVYRIWQVMQQFVAILANSSHSNDGRACLCIVTRDDAANHHATFASKFL